MEAGSRSSPMSTPFRMSTPREFLHTETPSHSSSFLRNEGVAALRVHARPSLRSTSRCRWCWTPISTASGSTRPTLHRTSAPTLHGRVPPSLSRPTPPPSSWLLSQRRTHLQLSRSGANWVLNRVVSTALVACSASTVELATPHPLTAGEVSPIFNLGWALLPLLSRPSWLTAFSTLPIARRSLPVCADRGGDFASTRGSVSRRASAYDRGSPYPGGPPYFDPGRTRRCRSGLWRWCRTGPA